jgi:hypothetical protein
MAKWRHLPATTVWVTRGRRIGKIAAALPAKVCLVVSLFYRDA